MKYKLTARFPLSPELGYIADFDKTNPIYNVGDLPHLKEEDCIEYKEHWSPYLFTTNDGFDVYESKGHYKNTKTIYVFYTNSVKYSSLRTFYSDLKDRLSASFISEEKAKEYQENLLVELETKQSQFKVGDLVVYEEQEPILGRVIEFITLINEQTVNVYIKTNFADVITANVNYLRLATLEEQVEYYKQEGFTKGNIISIYNIGEVEVNDVIIKDNQVKIQVLKEEEDCSSVRTIEAEPKLCTYLRTKEEQDRLITVRLKMDALLEELYEIYPDVQVKDLANNLFNASQHLLTVIKKTDKGACEVSFNDGGADWDGDRL